MKQRLLTGWNFIRVLYLIAGVMMLVQSMADRQWLLALVGLYFTVIGLVCDWLCRRKLLCAAGIKN
jgi:hypothetical protein